MQRKPKLRELIAKAQSGERDAVNEVVHRFIPLIRKYSRRLGYDQACADLVVWIVSAVHRYQPNTKWGKNELERCLLHHRDHKK
ncbi:hypothetical protein SY88_00055 [Clostridiales bacterium PH28_bin88]|nr:hypothetical protein SY88_00055 [Clostridiales bacterium PH28_bin88]